MKVPPVVFAIPWVLVLIGLSEIFLGAFSRLINSDSETGIRLFNIAGILAAVGGLFGVLLTIIGWVVGNKPMMIHGLIAAAAGALFIAKVLSGPANTNYRAADSPSQSNESK